MKKNRLAIWFKISLVSLVVVALYGTLMRYKIAFHFPFFEQKNLLHAHSHFAFSGWISHFLYCGLVYWIQSALPPGKSKKYYLLLAANLVCAFGMLVSFTIQGYGLISISFSTLAILISFAFLLFFINDLRHHLPARQEVRPWAVTGLLLNVIASAGPFSLAWMMATKSIDHQLYLASVYYYLHFQYNGWFFFAAMGIAINHLPANAPSLKKYFRVFALTIIPTFFLSVLWIKIPLWVYILTVAATLLQLGAWIALLKKLWPVFTRMAPRPDMHWIRVFFYAATIAITIKFVLQTISVIPSLSQLVFGIRPIVIAYLHLVLLGVYSLFVIGYLFVRGYIAPSRLSVTAAFTFLAAVVLHELLLAIQGFAAFSYFPIPYMSEMLFGAAALLLLSASGMLIGQSVKINGHTLPSPQML